MKDNETGSIEQIFLLNFSDSKIPEVKKASSSKPYMVQGVEDDIKDHAYPDHLLYLYNKSAKHNAIVNGKVNYIIGGGLKPKVEDAKAVEFLAKANGYGETMEDVVKKATTDIEIFGGTFIQVVPTKGGGFELFNMEWNKTRTNKEQSEFYFKHNWDDKKEDVKKFPAFNPANLKDSEKLEPSVFYYTEYRPGADVYPLPGYVGAINYIEADIEVSKWTLTNAQKGFSATKMISLFNGEPSEEKKKEISKKFNNHASGSEGEKILFSYNNDPLKAPKVEDLGSSDLTKEDFSVVDKMIEQNIYAGHGITTPALFGIKTEGQLGANNELRNGYEIFKNTYVSGKQRQIEKIVNFFAHAKGIQVQFELIPTEPLGIEFSEATISQVAPRSWMMEKLGIDVTKYPDAPAVAGAAPVPQPGQEQAAVNDHLKNLTGKQNQQLERILRKYDNGTLTKERAETLLRSSLGLSDEEIGTMLGFAAEEFSEEAVALMFEEVGEGADDFEIIESKKVNFSSNLECLEAELQLRESFEIEDPAAATATAKKINDAKKAGQAIPRIYIKYSYEPLPGLEPVIATTRPFCKKLVSLNRLYSRTEIERISERVGYSVWDRRGGFWGDKATCRHRWVMNVVVKRNK